MVRGCGAAAVGEAAGGHGGGEDLARGEAEVVGGGAARAGGAVWKDSLPEGLADAQVGDRDVELWNIHTLPPRTPEYLAPYLEALDSVAAFMERAAAAGESFVVTGDLNATPTSRFAGRVRGWPWAPGPAADAWELVGGGFGFTWPNGVFPLPEARMDHVYLSHDLTIGTIEVGRGAGSDHRPLRVTIAPACPAP